MQIQKDRIECIHIHVVVILPTTIDIIRLIFGGNKTAINPYTFNMRLSQVGDGGFQSS